MPAPQPIDHRVSDSLIRVVETGRKRNAFNISCERVIRRGHISTKQPFSNKVKVEETLVYEMACDFPQTNDTFFGAGEYYVEIETTGAYWMFNDKIEADLFILHEFLLTKTL